MLYNIKAYQTASQCSPSQNPPSCWIHGCFLQKNHFWLWLVASKFVYTHIKCSGFADWMV